jgi:hypothetical protein
MSVALEKMLHDRLQVRLERLGFQSVSSLTFRRIVGECGNLITATARMEDGKMKFTCTLGLQFESIELLTKGRLDKAVPSIVCPIHLLASSREFYEWEFADEAQADISVDSLVEEFLEVGQPFFERFGTLDAVTHELRENPVSQSLVVAHHQRTAILASYEVMRGHRDEAEGIFNEALGDPKNQNPGRKRRLEELRVNVLAK